MNSEEFNTLDREFGAYAVRLGGAPEIAEIAAAALHAVRDGHCAWPIPDLETRRILAENPRVAAADPAARTPLVVDGDLLYLHKFHQCETTVADGVLRRLEPMTPPLRPDWERVHEYFSGGGAPEQRHAAEIAVNSRFAVVTGGPGTGKTTVAAAILALEIARNPNLRIALAAPTGKAAARLAEAIQAEIPRLRMSFPANWEGFFAPLTLHRLLGMHGPGRPPEHGPENPLRADLVMLDEASMISLPLMARLFSALRPDARLILLGDADQLNSIECGSVLNDLVRAAPAVPVARLRTNYRARSNPRLVDFAVRLTAPDADADALGDELAGDDFPEFGCTPLPSPGRIREELRKRFDEWELRPPRSPEEAFALADSFKILCSVREGPYGVRAMNAHAAALLNLEPGADGAPVMVLENQPVSGLANGDVGIWWGGRVRFPGMLREFAGPELPPTEPALAMTVHKSQGSGFDRVLMVTAPDDLPIHTRELIYTGLTRTRRILRLWSTPEVLRAALERKTFRCSGLTVRITRQR